jgi:hypothetical protein
VKERERIFWLSLVGALIVFSLVQYRYIKEVK